MSAVNVQMNFEKQFSYDQNCILKVMKAYRRSSGITPLILNRGSGRKEVVSMLAVVSQSRSGSFGEGKISSPYQHSIPGPFSP